jgi:outer membrane protein assembly factor BamE (lipoprotein component of BamABCDE complex)
MTRKRSALLLLVASCLGVVGFAAYLLPRSSAINEENVARIQKGMTLAQVEAILGGPARDEEHGAGS